MQFDLAHLKGRRVPVAHEIADKPLIVLDRFGALAIADPRRLTDRRIVAHIVDNADKPVVQHRVSLIKMCLHPLANGTQRRHRCTAQCLDFGLLVWGQRHGGILLMGSESLATISCELQALKHYKERQNATGHNSSTLPPLSLIDNQASKGEFARSVLRGSFFMNRFVSGLAVFCLLGACSGDGTNPFQEPLVEDDNPSTANSKFLFNIEDKLTMNDVSYDADNNVILINNLPFDGPSQRYLSDRTQGGVGLFKSIQTATTGQIQHFAVFMQNEDMQVAAAAGVNWIDYGYAGANVKRNTYRLPGGVGEYV